MYRRILVAVENSPADRTILSHVSELARLTGAALLLVHVADGWAARNFNQLKLRESEEMKADRARAFDDKAFLGSLVACRLQRHMQALGAYGFLSEVKGKKYFLKHVPEALRLLKADVAEARREQPELARLVAAL